MRSRGALALLLTITVAGCPMSRSIDGADGTADEDASIDVGLLRDTPLGGDDFPIRDPDVPIPSGARAYVIADLDVPIADLDRAPGMNLDGRISAGLTEACDDAPDQTSPISGIAGVDNQWAVSFAPVASTLSERSYAETFRASVTAGDDLLVVEVGDLDSYVADDVVVHLYVGRTERPWEPPLLDADGRLRPGQAFRELLDLGTSEGRVEDGVLIARFDAFAPPFGYLPEANITVREVRLRASIDEVRLSSGELGGAVTIDDLVSVLAATGLGVDAATLVGIIEPDLRPSPGGIVCDAFSVGFTFEAVSAISLGPAP